MVNLVWIFGFDKNSGVWWFIGENKMEKNKKKNSLKHWATGLRS